MIFLRDFFAILPDLIEIFIVYRSFLSIRHASTFAESNLTFSPLRNCLLPR